MKKIDSFRNEYFFLNNFYPASISYDGRVYTNSEAAFQAQKCKNDKDKNLFIGLDASTAKRKGRKIELHKDWEQVKVTIMKDIVRTKFTQNIELKEKLLATEDAYLEEGNNWGDRIWGTVDGQGANLLGNILMEIRDELRTDIQNK